MTPAIPRTLATIAAAAVLALLPAGAPAEAKVKHLWATVNICDTPNNPDKLGVRGRMPGNGKRQRMYMRFFAQFRDEGRWKSLKPRGKSPRFYAGSALFEYQELGYSFDVEVPDGEQVILRGVVHYEWRTRDGNTVLKRERRETTAHHHSVGADPNRYSAARCTMEGDPVVQPRAESEADAETGPQARLLSPPAFR